jgi:light-regulated signal transduction histidine kinase (bacteriophytochrome)
MRFASELQIANLHLGETAAELHDSNTRLADTNHELGEANAALERRAKELIRSNEDLEQFASIASHDLQEPLRKVRTFTQRLTETEATRLSDHGRDYLTRADGAAERMQRLIEDLLKFSRVSTQARSFVEVDLEQVAQTAIEDLSQQIEDAHAVVRIGPLPAIQADPLQMGQLLQNLISNALKFRRDGVDPEIDVSATETRGWVDLRISDNGIGFDSRYSQRIFRVFERLHGRTEYPGTGIGLALCRKIADRHGGSIEAHGELGVGAVFTVTLPMDPNAGLASAASAEPAIAGEQMLAGEQRTEGVSTNVTAGAQ